MQNQYETNLRIHAVDADGDWVYGHGEADVWNGLEAMRLAIKYRIQAVAGEWWQGDPGAIPWMTRVLGSRMQTEELTLLITTRILDTVGVLSIDNIVSDMIGRAYHFKCDVRTVYGNTVAEVTQG